MTFNIEQEPLVSIVIVSWNRREILRQVLRAIRCQSYEHYEIIVVDNNSKDGTVEMIEREFPDVKLIRLPENMGVWGYNVGFANCKGQFIVGLDDDSFPEKNAIRRAIWALQEDHTIGIVAGTIAKPDEPYRPSNWWLSTDKPFEEGGADEIAFTGGGFVARADLLKEIGGYPKEFFVYHNEFPVAIAIRLRGYHIKRFSDVIFYHWGVSQKEKATFAIRHFYYPFRNLLLLYDWYYPFHLRILYKFNALVFYALASLRARAVGQYVRAIFSAAIISLQTKAKRQHIGFIREYDHYLVRPYLLSWRKAVSWLWGRCFYRKLRVFN